MPFNKYERLAMGAADAESQTMEKLSMMASQKPSLRMRILCGKDTDVWRERSAMRAADVEAHNSMATRIRILTQDAKTLADQLHWHENLRDATQSLARANLLQHQGLPSWIILNGMKIGEAVADRQNPAVQTAGTPCTP